MPYVGNSPAANFASVTKDLFSGDGSTVAFTLSKASTTNGVAVFVENVRQEPTIAYAVSGTTLTFTAAPVTSSGNNIYVLHHNAPASTANHPASQDLTAINGTLTGGLSVSGGTLGVGSNKAIVATTSTANLGRIESANSNTGDSYHGFELTNGSAFKGGLFRKGSDSIVHLFDGGGNSSLQIDTNGHVTMPKQPAFSVTANQQNNLAINTTSTIQFANEIFDLNADFNTSNYTFTAPVTGKYMLNVNLRMDNVDIAHMYMYMILATSNREYEWLLDISEYQNDLDYLPFTINVLADMDASDTALVKMHIPNAGTAQSDVVGSNKTTFSGFLVC